LLHKKEHKQTQVRGTKWTSAEESKEAGPKTYFTGIIRINKGRTWIMIEITSLSSLSLAYSYKMM